MKKNILLIILLIIVATAGWFIYDTQRLSGNNNLARVNPVNVVIFENMYWNYLRSQADPNGLDVDFVIRVNPRNKPLLLPVKANIDIIDVDSGKVVTSIVSNSATAPGTNITAIPVNTPTRLSFRTFVVPNSQLSFGSKKYQATIRSFSWEGGSQVASGFQTNYTVHNRPLSPGDMSVQPASSNITVVQTSANGLVGLESKFNIRVTISGEHIRQEGMNGVFEVVDTKTGIRVPDTDWAFILGPGPQLQKGQTYTLTFPVKYPAHRLTPDSSYKIVMKGIRFTDINGNTKSMPINPAVFATPTVIYAVE